MLKIIKVKDYDEISKKASEIIAAQLILKNDSILGLATGSTPIGTYKYLIEKYNNQEIDFSKVKSINLDEYVGLETNNNQSYRYFMNHNLFNHVNIDKNNTNVPNGLEQDENKECERYHKLIENNPIDLQILGIGNNGHIGFNEPSDTFSLKTHKVKLTESTIEANKRFFESIDEVPKYAYTMGIGEIMSAKKILILASGKAKAPIIKKLLENEVTPNIPASILKFHNDCTLIVDKEAFEG